MQVHSQPPRRRKNSRGSFKDGPLIESLPQRALTFPREIRGDKCVASLNGAFCGSCCGRHKNSRRRSRPSGVYTDLNCGAPFTLSHPLRATREAKMFVTLTGNIGSTNAIQIVRLVNAVQNVSETLLRNAALKFIEKKIIRT